MKITALTVRILGGVSIVAGLYLGSEHLFWPTLQYRHIFSCSSRRRSFFRSYDGFGNKTAQTVTKGSGPVMNVTYDVNNRVISYAFSYDANGNVTVIPNQPGHADVRRREPVEQFELRFGRGG